MVGWDHQLDGHEFEYALGVGDEWEDWHAIVDGVICILRLLIIIPAILISPCVSPSPAFHMMYSAYKLNKLGDNIQP